MDKQFYTKRKWKKIKHNNVYNNQNKTHNY